MRDFTVGVGSRNVRGGDLGFLSTGQIDSRLWGNGFSEVGLGSGL